MTTIEADHVIIRNQRLRLGITGQGVEENAEIPLQSYQQFESGKRQIRRASFQIAGRVLDALEMDITSFLHRGQ